MEAAAATDDTESITSRAHSYPRLGARCPPRFCDQRCRHDDPFFEAYRFVCGYNVRPLEICGAVGREQLKKLDSMVQVRRANAAVFANLFNGDERFIIQRENGHSSWFSFTLVLNPDLRIDRAGSWMRCGRRTSVSADHRRMFLRHEAIKYFDYETAGPIVNANVAHDQGSSWAITRAI